MTKAQLMERVMSGQTLIVCKYQGGKAAMTTVRAGAGQQGRRDACIVRETFMTADDVLTKSEWMPDGFKAETWKPTLDKGKDCVIIVEEQVMEAGTRVIQRGTVEPLVA